MRCVIMPIDTVPVYNAVMRPAAPMYLRVRDFLRGRLRSYDTLKNSIMMMEIRTVVSVSCLLPVLPPALTVPGPMRSGIAIAPARCCYSSLRIPAAVDQWTTNGNSLRKKRVTRKPETRQIPPV